MLLTISNIKKCVNLEKKLHRFEINNVNDPAAIILYFYQLLKCIMKPFAKIIKINLPVD